MQQGWKRRRSMEAAIGREALRRAHESRRRTRIAEPAEDRLARVSRLAREATDAALEELCGIVDTADDEVRFAARVALRTTVRRTSHQLMLEEEYDA